ncbi:MAG: (d)CMP kinase [Salinivirgaceae bacterium]
MENPKKRLTIAIDGHSSCGKSTVAKDLAKVLGYTYIDSGAMYRSVTLFCMEHGLMEGDHVDETELKNSIQDLTIHFTFDETHERYITWMNHQEVEDKIRTLAVSNNVSAVSKIGFVREKLVKLQQEMGKKGGIVMDGRDIGTVVFPQAELKIFMTASPQVRAQRRFDEIKATGQEVSFQEVLDNIEKRDFIDANRDISPLRKADDAIILDNSFLTKQEQLEKLIALVNQRSK